MADVSTMEVLGLKELEEALFELGNSVSGKVLYSSLMAASTPMWKMARAMAPMADRPYWRYWKGGKKLGKNPDGTKILSAKQRKMIQSGSLRKNITRLRVRDVDPDNPNAAQVGIRVRRDAFYGRFFEFGTPNMAAKPFLRPAFDAKKEEAVEILKAKLTANIDKARAKAAAAAQGANR